MALSDPNLPAGAIVKELTNGGFVRNDGVELRPASENVWYRILTAYGEQSGRTFDHDLHKKNQRIWNGWACGHLSAVERKELCKLLGLEEYDLRPLDDWENRQLELCLGGVGELPIPDVKIDFSSTFFASSFDFIACVSLGVLDFRNSVFAKDANFHRAEFQKEVLFPNAMFERTSRFTSSQFYKGADLDGCFFNGFVFMDTCKFGGSLGFRGVCFENGAFFGMSDFVGSVFFDSARFKRTTSFTHACFNGFSDFQNGSFSGATDFRNVNFVGEDVNTPLFHNCKMHQDTRFTLDATLWPTPTVDNAEDEKEAFTRLRQIMVELHKPDDQHFFLRREMAAKAFLGPWYDRLATIIYGKVADYGWSMMRPLCCLGFVWLVGMVVFLGYFSDCCTIKAKDFEGTPFWAAFGVSFSNTFGFLGIGRVMFAADFYRDLPQVLKFVSGLQTVFGVIFLFFFGLGLRNRFRLK